MNILDQLHYARKLDNFEVDATGATAHWPDTTHYLATVPTSKRWFLFGGNAYRDVSSTMDAWIRNAADQDIQHIATHAAATGNVAYPLAAYAGSILFPYVLDAGDYLRLIFGVAQGAGAYASANVLEVDV